MVAQEWHCGSHDPVSAQGGHRCLWGARECRETCSRVRTPWKRTFRPGRRPDLVQQSATWLLRTRHGAVRSHRPGNHTPRWGWWAPEDTQRESPAHRPARPQGPLSFSRCQCRRGAGALLGRWESLFQEETQSTSPRTPSGQKDVHLSLAKVCFLSWEKLLPSTARPVIWDFLFTCLQYGRMNPESLRYAISPDLLYIRIYIHI